MRKKFIGIFSILAVISIIGGMFMFQSYLAKKKEEKQVQMRKEQRSIEKQLVKKIINEYDGVQKIEFKQWGHSEKTGFWGVRVVVKDKNKISYTFSDLSTIKSLRGSTYHPDSFMLKKKRVEGSGREMSVEVIYSWKGN